MLNSIQVHNLLSYSMSKEVYTNLNLQVKKLKIITKHRSILIIHPSKYAHEALALTI